MTKPLATFAAAKVSPDDVDAVGRFLLDVAGHRKGRAA
jgi:hypothetical protein